MAAAILSKWKCPITKYVSWNPRSKAIRKNQTCKPPNTKQDIEVPTKTNVQSLKFISVKARDQAKILTAVGTPMTNVAQEKYILVTSAIPTVNIWCAHTKNLQNLWKITLAPCLSNLALGQA